MILQKKSNMPGRPADRRNEIVDFIHGRIISGKFKPDERLPTRRSIQKKFNSSMATVQQAVDRLVTEGFVESRGVGGTFVSARPPHLNRYSVIVSAARLDDKAPLFWKTLVDSFSLLNSSSGVSIKVNYWPTEISSTPETRALASDVMRRSLAGVVFITPPLEHENDKEELLDSGRVPCAVLLSRKVVGKFKAATVALDNLEFIRMALDYFIENGRRRIAVISNLQPDDWWDDFNMVVGEKGIETRPYWKICVPNEIRGNVKSLANLLMQLPKDKLPDALLITDDNLAKASLEGLVDSGSKAVRNLVIVSHCNFPYRIRSSLPVKLLGYDSRQVAEASMKALGRIRKGENPVEVVEMVSPVFDN